MCRRGLLRHCPVAKMALGTLSLQGRFTDSIVRYKYDLADSWDDVKCTIHSTIGVVIGVDRVMPPSGALALHESSSGFPVYSGEKAPFEWS